MLDWQQDPIRKTLLVQPEEAFLLENLSRLIKEFPIEVAGPAPSEIEGELLFMVLCWWPYPDWPPPQTFGHSWSMSSMLANGKYRLRDELEDLSDKSCVVLEHPGRDVLWLDSAWPHCVLRREFYEEQTGALRWRCEYAEHSHYGGDVWLPRIFTNQHFDAYATSPEDQLRLVVNAKFELTDIRINADVVDDDFRLELLPGTVCREIRDNIESLIPVTAGQGAHAQQIADWAAAINPPTQRRLPSVWSQGTVSLWLAYGSAAGLICGLLLRLYRRIFYALR